MRPPPNARMILSPAQIKAIQAKVPESEREAFLDSAIRSALANLPAAPRPVAADGGLELFADGGSRGNPGPSGGGFALYQKGKLVMKGSEYFGEKTNNQAEYLALRLGMRRAYEEYGDLPLRCYMDSQLVVEQLNGRYKVKSSSILALHQEVSRIKEQFSSFAIQHIPREQNKVADRLANEAMDRN